MNARRAALDHILSLVAGSACGDTLVLRGSMSLLAWLGDRAREPGDLDWVVRPIAVQPPDPSHPYPYVSRIDKVRSAPETAHGAVDDEIWTFEEFDTEGAHPRVPPAGLRWATAEDIDFDTPHLDLLDLIRERPQAPGGPRLDADAATFATDWSYAYSSTYGKGGARILLPWTAADGSGGTVQLDFAYDETLPEPAVLSAVPRADGGTPNAVWTASPALSLAWKLQWLAADQAAQGRSGGKDLYDAVLLAELDGMVLPPRLRRIPDRDALHPRAVRTWIIEDHLSIRGAVDHWLDRLAARLGPLLHDRAIPSP